MGGCSPINRFPGVTEGFGFRPAPAARAETQGAQKNKPRARSNPSLIAKVIKAKKAPLGPFLL
jgi:hypothetical protein